MEIEEYLNRVEYFVEATETETWFLWQMYCNESIFPTERTKYNWKQYSGFSYILGYINCADNYKSNATISDYPVNFMISFYEINGVMVGFFNCVSCVAQWDWCRQFIKENSYI